MLSTSRRFLATGIISFTLAFISPRAIACSCAPPPPPCEAIGWSDLVFLGTVTEVSAKPDDFKHAQMHIDKAYKGALKETIELFDDGMCNGPDLEVGRQYLMYTSGLPTGPVPARGCTRSRRVEDTDEDLAFLKEYSTGKITTRISGTVFRPGELEGTYEGRTPLKGVDVILTSAGKELRKTSDASGMYSFSGLVPAEYAISAELAGYRLDWAPENLTLHANGCAHADLLMKVDRRVQGLVRDDKGEPVEGALVEMISTDRQLKRWEQPILLAVSDKDGRYAIDGIDPGVYFLGINIRSTPTKEHPYASTYYPNTADIQQATPIIIPIGASVQEFDLRASSKLPLIAIQGRILNRNGEPPPAADHPQVRIKEPGLYGQIEEETIEIDSDGQFHFELCEGVRYSAFAFAGSTTASTYSAPVEFIPTKENDRLELVLNKTAEEFRKLRTKRNE